MTEFIEKRTWCERHGAVHIIRAPQAEIGEWSTEGRAAGGVLLAFAISALMWAGIVTAIVAVWPK